MTDKKLMNTGYKAKHIHLLLLATGLLTERLALAKTCLYVSEDTQLREISSFSKSEKPQLLKANTCNSVILQNPIELESENTIPVILVPVSNASEISVQSPKKKEVVQKLQEQEIGQLMSQIMSHLFDIQSQIKKRQFDQALHQLTLLEGQYPSLKILEFTRASIILLQGNREEAKHIAEEALREVPNYDEGKRFVESLNDVHAGGEKR